MSDQLLPTLSELRARKLQRGMEVEVAATGSQGVWDRAVQRHREEAEADIASYEQIIAMLVAAGEAMYEEWGAPEGSEEEPEFVAWRTLLRELGEK